MMGPPNAPPTSYVGSPSWVKPPSTLLLPEYSVRLGATVMKRTAPPIVDPPYKVPCGPRSTSTRSRSNTLGYCAPKPLPVEANLCVGTSSIYTPVVAAPAVEATPRNEMLVSPLDCALGFRLP